MITYTEFVVEFRSKVNDLARQCLEFRRNNNKTRMDYLSVCNFVKNNCDEILRQVDMMENTENNDVKIIFVGNVSNGKSSVINKLLGSAIMSFAVLHTTRCFVRVSRSPESKVIFPDNSEIICIHDDMIRAQIDRYMSNLHSQNRSTDSELQIHLLNDSPILANDVYLYDSMGLGFEPESLEFIKQKCGQMDILIVVAPYNFVMEQKTTMENLANFVIGIPVIILINKWDKVVKNQTKDMIEMTKIQIENDIKETFKAVQLTEKGSMSHMWFFVSAKKSNDENNEFPKFESHLLDMIEQKVTVKRKRLEKIAYDIKLGVKQQANQLEFLNLEMRCEEFVTRCRGEVTTLKYKCRSLLTIMTELKEVNYGNKYSIQDNGSRVICEDNISCCEELERTLDNLAKPSYNRAKVGFIGNVSIKNAAFINSLIGKNIFGESYDLPSQITARVSMSGQNKFVDAKGTDPNCSNDQEIKRYLYEYVDNFGTANEVVNPEIHIELMIDHSILRRDVFLYMMNGLGNKTYIGEMVKDIDILVFLIYHADTTTDMLKPFKDFHKFFTGIRIYILIVSVNENGNLDVVSKEIKREIGNILNSKQESHDNAILKPKQMSIVNEEKKYNLGAFISNLEEYIDECVTKKKERFNTACLEIENTLKVKKNNYNDALDMSRRSLDNHKSLIEEAMNLKNKQCCDISKGIEKSGFEAISSGCTEIIKRLNVLHSTDILDQDFVTLFINFMNELCRLEADFDNAATTLRNTFQERVTSSEGKVRCIKQKCTDMIQGIADLSKECKKCSIEEKTIFEDYSKSCDEISLRTAVLNETLNDKLNIICVGQLSSGKSYVLNNLLQQLILKSSIGQTTRCFVRLSRSDRYKVVYPDGKEEECETLEASKAAIDRYNDDLISKNMTSDLEISVNLAIDDLILPNYVSLYDSPGFGKCTKDDDSIIEKCMAMDIIILVLLNSIPVEVKRLLKEIYRRMAFIRIFVVINKCNDSNTNGWEESNKLIAEVKLLTNQNNSDIDLISFYVIGPSDGVDKDASLNATRTDFSKAVANFPASKMIRHNSNNELVESTLGKLNADLVAKKTEYSPLLEERLGEFNGIVVKFTEILPVLESYKKNLDSRIGAINIERIDTFLETVESIESEYTSLYKDVEGALADVINTLPVESEDLRGYKISASKLEKNMELMKEIGALRQEPSVAENLKAKVGKGVLFPPIGLFYLGALIVHGIRDTSWKKKIAFNIQLFKEECHNACDMLEKSLNSTRVKARSEETIKHIETMLEHLK